MPQRMFFVTMLLNEVLAWIRTQPGTSSLRAILYMDEVFGYFPPLGNPPAKRPMLTLLKQARAYGLGCVLATQNPVDLDYKGLSNAGTWFLGRLQTERDKARVIEGLEGASAQAGATFNRQQMEATLAALGNRVFLMNNVHDDAPVVFQTRWAMSYLCGPLTRGQIKTLMDPVRAQVQSHQRRAGSNAAQRTATRRRQRPCATRHHDAQRGTIARCCRPAFPRNSPPINERVPDGFQLEYRPGLLGKGKVHFVARARGIDVWRECYLLQTMQTTPPDDVWEGATLTARRLATEDAARRSRPFAELPSEMAREKSYSVFARQLKEHLYREESLSSGHARCSDERRGRTKTRTHFRTPTRRRCWTPARTRSAKNSSKRTPRSWPTSKIEFAGRKPRLSTQRWQFFARLGGMLWVVADTVMSALGKGLPGRRRSLDPAFRSVATERGQQSNAQISVESALKEKQQLEQQHQEQVKALEASFNPQRSPIESLELKPQKSDIEVDKVSLVWLRGASMPTARRAACTDESLSPRRVDTTLLEQCRATAAATAEPSDARRFLQPPVPSPQSHCHV